MPLEQDSASVDLRSSRAFDDAVAARTARVGIVGLGYAGLPLAMGFAEAGFAVTGIDVNPERCQGVNERRSYLTDVSDDELARLGPRLRATTQRDAIAELAALTICVPTPLSKTRTPDLAFVAAATEAVAENLAEGQLVVLQSTTVPGTTMGLVVRTLEEVSGGSVGCDFFVGYAPERVDPANTSGWTLRNTPKVVSGVTPECRRRTRLLYEQVCDTVVEASSTTVAELVKLYENTFRQVNIALANELALMCARLDVDAWEVIDIARTKPFGFLAHYPGPGLGGDCIPVVPHFLTYRLREHGYDTRLIDVAHAINTSMPKHVVDTVIRAMNDRSRSVRGSRILIAGVAYKPNVGDIRESPALEIFAALRSLGAEVNYSDPHVRTVEVGGMLHRRLPWTAEALAEHDCVLVLTHHDEFLHANLWHAARLVVDTRRIVPEAAWVERI